MYFDLKKKLPINLKTQFWKDFMDSISEEFNNLEDQIRINELLTNTREQTDYDELIYLSKMFGYTPDLSLDPSLTNLRENIDSIGFRIRGKTTYLSYNYIFKTIPYIGEMFMLYWANTKLVRASEPILDIEGYLTTCDKTLPFRYPSEKNYSEFLFTELYIDTGLQLDSATTPWYLDSLTSFLKTNHIAPEFSIESLFTKDAVEYIMVDEYLDYLNNAVEYTRKVTEVPHIGAHISFIMDESTFFDNYSAGAEAYSIPLLKTNCSVLDTYVPVDPTADYTKLVVGVGTQELKSVLGPGSFPTALAHQCSYSDLCTDELNETDNWKLVNSIVQTNTVRGDYITTGDGDVMEVLGTTEFPLVKPYTFKMPFSTDIQNYIIVDNGDGKLYISEELTNPLGTINYTTGDYYFKTQKLNSSSEDITDAPVNSINFFCTFTPVKRLSVKIKFTLDGGQYYVRKDDGVGNFTGGGLGIGSTINYDTGFCHIVFSSTTMAGMDITVEYDYVSDYPVKLNQELFANYEVTGGLDITEAGILDANDNLIAYATFPPFQSGDSKYHIGLQFFIEKTTP